MSPLAVCRTEQPDRRPVQVYPDPLAGGYAQVLAALGPEPPQRLAMWPRARELDERRDYVRGLLKVLYAYLQEVLGDVAQTVPCELDLRQIEALYCDLTSEVMGTLESAGAALPGRWS
jgi:hypothetical protein